MTIQVGEKIPHATFRRMGKNGPEAVSTEDFFNGRKVVIFGLPGAFTPVCSARHLPGFIEHSDEFKAKGVDDIACVSVNDAFVMDAWAQANECNEKIAMLADGSRDFTQAVGLEWDATDKGMGVRSKRYAMVVEDGVVKSLHIDGPNDFNASSAENVLKEL